MKDALDPENGKFILRVNSLVKHYPLRGGILSRKIGYVKAVQDVSLDIREGETLGLVGESGCGKSTLARTMILLEKPTSGNILFEGKDIASLSSKELFQVRRKIQMIFQDPYSSLNPRMTIGEIIRDPLIVHKTGSRKEQEEKVASLLIRVGLSPDMMDRYPHEFSGGQRQRIGIARALALDPQILIADEPVSSLDVSVQSQALNLLTELQKDMELTYLFISHDLSVVEYISDRIAVMYLGRIVEMGDTKEIFENPAHPYTRALMEAVPVPDPKRGGRKIILKGEPPSAIHPPSGCAFHPRCPFVIPECRKQLPLLEPFSPRNTSSHLVACIRK
ncbi:dipeptide ABC transporter ATP-binding protein [Candidatus Sumerlaeota bacterium]|nr:dipeptide ABC transporter ATP-binding protein [Candidatus Sumerlaeota bacterium]